MASNSIEVDPMYVLNVSYSQSPQKVGPHASGHSAWVKQHLEKGTFLFAGPKKSGLGGVILVKSIPRKELQTLLSEDSYVQAEVADYEILDFDCKSTGPNLKNLAGA
jgi:uncharacterized protein YciI